MEDAVTFGTILMLVSQNGCLGDPAVPAENDGDAKVRFTPSVREKNDIALSH